MRTVAGKAFTLLELLVVIGLIAVLASSITGGLGAGSQSVALQSAQATMTSLVASARTGAMASGLSARVLVHIDPSSTSQPLRYLRYVAVQSQTPTGWKTVTAVYLPDGVYVVPGNFGSLPAGLLAASGTTTWTKSDGSALRSTALRSNQITTEMINGPVAEQWVSLTLSATAGTAQSGDIILAAGHPRPPGAYAAGESPVELGSPANVRGLTLSSYGVPALINDRASF